MRTTIVPAQITTVEDKIAGRLGLSQLLLLIAPVFGGSAIFVVLPPFFHYAAYKVVLIVCMAALSGLCAVRIKGTILLFWMIVLSRYNLRPRYYVFNKNSVHTREIAAVYPQEIVAGEAQPAHAAVGIRLPQLSTADIVSVENLITDPDAQLYFSTDKKGVLSVHLTEVK
jgi:hypothetical protein